MILPPPFPLNPSDPPQYSPPPPALLGIIFHAHPELLDVSYILQVLKCLESLGSIYLEQFYTSIRMHFFFLNGKCFYFVHGIKRENTYMRLKVCPLYPHS